MLFRQFTHDDLGCASYLIGDEDAGVAAVVDPKLDVEPYLALARYMGVRIEHILETHNHADHVSGHGRLAAATGATIHIHRDASPDYAHEPFDDGWELALGNVTVRLRLVGTEMSVQLAAERKDTSTMLDQQRGQIRDLMQSAGYVADVAPVQHGSLDGFQAGSGQSQPQLSGQQQQSSQSQGAFGGAGTSSGQSDGGARQARQEQQPNQEARHDQDVAPQTRRGPVYL